MPCEQRGRPGRGGRNRGRGRASASDTADPPPDPPLDPGYPIITPSSRGGLSLGRALPTTRGGLSGGPSGGFSSRPNLNESILDPRLRAPPVSLLAYYINGQC